MNTNFQDSANFVERRAVGAISTDSGWHLDKKVPLSLIFAMLVQAGMVIWAIADIKKDVELLKQANLALAQRDTAQIADFREAMRLMQDQFARLDAKLDRLIERSGK